MIKTILKNKISNIRKQIQPQEKCIFVLKGIPISLIEPDCYIESVEQIRIDKMAYFMKIYSNRKFLTYEEFLMLYPFVLAQYEKIYVLVNNIFMNQYPITEEYSERVRAGLLTHFSESENENDESEIGDIDGIIELYDGLMEHNGLLIGAYGEDKIPDDIKISYLNLFENKNMKLKSVDGSGQKTFFEIKEEADYIEFVRNISPDFQAVYVRMINYSGNKEQLFAHLAILNGSLSDSIKIFLLQPQENEGIYESRREYLEILKKYWKYDSFQKIEFYNLKKLEEGRKETVMISQEQIISDLVTQVENCEDPEKGYRDLFVTAPTGAGKSVIFQIPAIYLAEKYGLLTIVISPLIGLMNDQVSGLEKRSYQGARTINSDISPIVKEEVLKCVQDSKYHILYLSPETLLARSTVEQLIDNRTIGMIVIDEAHIVTTWGKQFRPDYWYLGDHIRKLRSNQIKKKGRSFVIASFTATAIYHGIEDMYEETRNSLQMTDPITYLGYIKRKDIEIKIDIRKKKGNERTEYETDKFENVIDMIKRAKITGKKTLVYFPTVKLIETCFEYAENKRMSDTVTKYYGPLPKDQKTENYNKFLHGESKVMFATKAFGMGIDIDDIELVVHYAPTGNVCDYVQEIGRAARRRNLEGEAYYNYNSRDFKYINRLHGLSTIKKYQLIEVVKKIDELYAINRKKNASEKHTKKRNAMLIDAENFTYIFNSPVSNLEDNINKVKTALLIIQKDFESRIGFSPITVRPIPLFSQGYFQIDRFNQRDILEKYPYCLEEIDEKRHICKVNLEKIWDKDYEDRSFPEFKYLTYTKDAGLKFNQEFNITAAVCISIEFAEDHWSKFEKVWSVIEKKTKEGVVEQKYIEIDAFVEALEKQCGIRKYKAQAICEVVFASMDIYQRKYSRNTHSIFQKRELKDGAMKYQFKIAINSYFGWVRTGFDKIKNSTIEGKMYIIGNRGHEVSVILGILETLDVLSFEMTGGTNSQLYIYINQVRNLKNIINNPYKYENKLLDMVQQRHLLSVKMLTYIYEGNFTSEEIWNILEDYFLGRIPEKVQMICKKENPGIMFE